VSEDNKRNLVFYGVNEKCVHNTSITTLYEEDLNIYNPLLQKRRFNEGSCIYHVYKNNLFENASYIGFFQYDMKFSNDFFNIINNKINDNTKSYIFASFTALKDSVDKLDGSLQFMITPISKIGSALDSYNNFFGTSYTIENVKQNYFVMCNTYVIPVYLYKKMMTWLENFFDSDINQKELEEKYFKNPGYLIEGSPENIINPGHLLEAFTAMFLSLELYQGMEIVYIPLEHVREYKI
jgi:hypothetical protein